jgi:ribose 1,5-bisphosphokinase
MPQGTLFFVVGPSGAGKDTLILEAMKRRPDLHLMQRTITRPAIDGEHEAISAEEFAARKHADHFALHWDAHGMRYGISRDLDAFLAQGKSVIVNGSRGIIHDVRERYDPLSIIQITAPLDVLSRRLRERGREDPDDIEYRLGRAERGAARGPDVITIVNGGTVDEGVSAFMKALGTAGDAGMAADCA